MKDYSINSENAAGQLPGKLVILDANVFIYAGIGDVCCLRIVGSQDKSSFNFGFPRGVEHETIDVLLRKFKGLGCTYIYKILKERNFARIDTEGLRFPYKWLEEMSVIDRKIIKLSLLDEIECVVSKDLRHVTYNQKLIRTLGERFYSIRNKLFEPEKFVEKYDSELVKLTEEEINEIREIEKEGIGRKKEDFQDLWVVEYV